MILGIHHVAIHTRNFEKMRSFYAEAFGFEPNGPETSWSDSPALDSTIGVHGSASRVQLLKAGTCYLELFQYSAPKGRSDTPLRPFDYGYTHFCVSVTDIGAEFERLKRLGMTFAHSQPVDLGEIIAIYGKDPDGNIIEITEAAASKPFALDQLAGREPIPTRM
jgi:catechol 2,3-dioxygenase-like lactoylglutathione lyase family enzyme